MLLVTGGAGYIGSHFLKAYLDNSPQAKALVLDDFSGGKREALGVLGNRISLYEGSLGDEGLVDQICKEHPIEAVAHFGASIVVSESQTNPFKYYENNVVNALRFFGRLNQHGVRKIIASSTCAVYGDPLYMPLDEKHPRNPVNVYGHTKLVLEQTIEQLARCSDWSYVLLRYFNASGADESGKLGEAHEPETHLIPNILQVAKGESDEVVIFGDDYETRDGTCVRDYIHVNDLAEAHIRALALLDAESGTRLAVNLGSTHGATNLEVLQSCRNITGREILCRFAARRPGDAPVLVANADYALKTLGWQTKYDLTKIVSSAWNWEQNRRY